MTTTSPLVRFGLYNLEVKQDSTPSTVHSMQSFSKLDDLRTDNVSGRPYATYEPDFWLLDGGYKFMPAESLVHVGMMSTEMSGSDGVLATPPVLIVDFASPHTTDGLALHFSPYTGDYITEILVQYYNAGGSVIQSNAYYPDAADFTVVQYVANFTRIVIGFYVTSRPYRYLRLRGIDYGQFITLTSADIKAASVVEDTDPVSAEVRGNTFDLKLFSEDAQFNILNPAGLYAALKERQPLSVYEIINTAPLFMGQYFLDTWKNTSDTIIEFSCVDLVGLMGYINTRGGLWASPGIAVEDLLELLLGGASIPYELDPTLTGTMIIGWLAAGTLREAVRQIAFAVGASVDCARSWAVKLYASKIATVETSTATITRAQKGVEQSLTLRPVIAGVDLTAHNYVNSAESKELYNGSLAAGTFEILFAQPMHTLTVTGAVILESGANYALLYVETPGTVTLSGLVVADTVQVYGITNPEVISSIRTVLRVTDATLVSPANVATVAQRIYDYQTQRYLQKLKLFAPVLEVGQVVDVDTLYSRQVRGVIEKMSIDLAGGMVTQAEIVGVAVTV